MTKEKTKASRVSMDFPVAIVELHEAPYYMKETSVKITKVLVVKEGTESGKPTVDLQLEDDKGNKYIALTTGALIDALASVVRGVESGT